MVELFGRKLSRLDLARRSGSFAQFSGVRLVELGDGVERGIRTLEFRTGTGLRFTVLIDRALDIAELEHNGRAIGWQSPSGFRHPGLSDIDSEGGLGWLRAFSGLLVTCGLDHTGFMAEEPGDHFMYGPRETVRHPLHGRISTMPARLTGYGETWAGDECTLWCEGVVQQSTVFGEDLHLIRRIEARVGSSEIRLSDRVINNGFYRTPHMYLYHINVGYPLLDEGARFVAPVREVIRAAHLDKGLDHQGAGYRRVVGPRDGFYEQVWQHDLAADENGHVPFAVMNDALGMGFAVEVLKSQFPCFYQWQNFQSGQYAMGIEPGTNHALGRDYAREKGELIQLDHGEERRYDAVMRVLDGAAAIAEAEARIRQVGGQPDEDYPTPSGHHAALR